LASGAQFAPPSLALSVSGVPGGPRLSASIGKPLLSQLAGPSAALSATYAPTLTTSISAAASLASAPRLQGVDLRLDKFDLSEPKRVGTEAQVGTWGSLDDCTAVGEAFWSALEGNAKLFKEEDRALLKQVFNPKLTDRRPEGDRFVPPDASHFYVTKLRSLAKEEDHVRQHRKTCFLSKNFSMGEPGANFPSSWSHRFDIARAAGTLDGRLLIPRQDYLDQAADFLKDTALHESSPVFDKSTEEGLRFRIYCIGSVEVRTTQEVGCEEVVGAVFSIRNPTGTGSTAGNKQSQEISDKDKITKATEYVERIYGPMDSSKPSARRRYYVVLEIEHDGHICTERLASGEITWEVQPEGLQDRSSFAKVTRSKEVKGNVTVGIMKALQASEAFDAANLLQTHARARLQSSPSMCKRYARTSFKRAIGAVAPPARPSGLPASMRP